MAPYEVVRHECIHNIEGDVDTTIILIIVLFVLKPHVEKTIYLIDCIYLSRGSTKEAAPRNTG